ncbi:MAG: helix-turn-helix domain-containing protein [Proteobacteria bacterium]|nr:helix-turn-helix domain-containing protein [Pseudomonadota bacterium]
MTKRIPANVQIPPMVWKDLTPQGKALLSYLNTTGSITQRDAILDLGVQSLTKRIHELRAFYVIVSDTRRHKTTGQRYVRYFLKSLRDQYREF